VPRFLGIPDGFCVVTRAARAFAHRHYLGTWDPADRVRLAPGATVVTPTLAFRPLDARESAEIAVEGASEADVVLAAMTVPAKLRKDLWQLEWDGEASTMTPRDEQAFTAYGRRVVAFFRAAGVALAEPCETRLLAVAPGVSEVSALVVVNVGDAPCAVATTCALGALSVRVPPDEACLLSAGGKPYFVVVPDDAEFGLVLALG
jgi:hypothetical protein